MKQHEKKSIFGVARRQLFQLPKICVLSAVFKQDFGHAAIATCELFRCPGPTYCQSEISFPESSRFLLSGCLNATRTWLARRNADTPKGGQDTFVCKTREAKNSCRQERLQAKKKKGRFFRHCLIFSSNCKGSAQTGLLTSERPCKVLCFSNMKVSNAFSAPLKYHFFFSRTFDW
jgi:hypothetical protein